MRKCEEAAELRRAGLSFVCAAAGFCFVWGARVCVKGAAKMLSESISGLASLEKSGFLDSSAAPLPRTLFSSDEAEVLLCPRRCSSLSGLLPRLLPAGEVWHFGGVAHIAHRRIWDHPASRV